MPENALCPFFSALERMLAGRREGRCAVMTRYGYNFDYSQTMMMKLFLSSPDTVRGGSHVNCTFEEALGVIRKTDALTLGAPKILYLVGWQYDGHDDKYPAFFEVNPALKRACDPDAVTSLLWLIGEAKRYHTVVSLHINFCDAYEDSPLWEAYVRAGALIRDKDGRPEPVENYNGKPCYKVSFKEEWESGLFRDRIRRLCELVPLEEIGTVHADNFLVCYNNAPPVDLAEEQDYRDRMIDYLRESGIDVTSEFPYREGPSGRESHSHSCMGKPEYPIRTLGRIPAFWWFDNLTDEEYLRYPPAYFGGGMPHDPAYAEAFCGNIHGEELWLGERLKSGSWTGDFLRQFCMIQLPYFWLCRHQRERIENRDGRKTAYFSEGIVSGGGRITQYGRTVKTEDYGCLPVPWMDGAWVIWSDGTAERAYYVPEAEDGELRVSVITPDSPEPVGPEPDGTARIENGTVSLHTEAQKAYVLLWCRRA